MALTKVSFSMIEGDVINVLDYGAKGDSNGTPGNGTDDTAAIQAAVTAAGDTGKIVFLPVGTYRITAPINFTGDTNKFGFHGESNLQTIIYADFTSVTKQAALSLNNTTGTRAYVSFKNFRLQGKLDPNTVGIYCNFTGSFSQLEDVVVSSFYDGILIANDYQMKIVQCFSLNNLNNGLQIGYLIDGVTLAQCNNITILGGLYNVNGANGIYVIGCRAIDLVQCTAEANEFTNIFLQNVLGGNLSSVYMEYDNALTPLYSAQLRLSGCNGVTINGLSVSAFKAGAGPVIDIDGSNGIVISGVAIELGFLGTTLSATAIRLFNAFNTTIEGCVIDGCSVGVNLLTNARCTINNVNFSNYTNPLAVSDSANCRVQWKNTQPVWVTASSIGANAKIDLEYIDNKKNVIDGTNVFNVSVSFSELAAGATKKIIDSTLAGERWRIIDIIAVGLTPANAGGDRGLGLSDGTSVYTVIPAATLKTSNFQGRWGSTNVPFSAAASAMIQPTVAGTDLVAYWSGGTTDYTAGLFNIQVTAERIA